MRANGSWRQGLASSTDHGVIRPDAILAVLMALESARATK